VLSDNGSAYRSKPCQLACEALGLTPKRTRPNTPRTNGKAERFIKTLESEWAYGMSFQSSAERNRWLSRYLAIYNRRRRPMALAGRTPFQELALLRATEWPGEKTYLGSEELAVTLGLTIAMNLLVMEVQKLLEILFFLRACHTFFLAVKVVGINTLAAEASDHCSVMICLRA